MVKKVAIFHVNNLEGFSGIPKNLLRALQGQGGLDVAKLNLESAYRPAVMKRIMKRVARTMTGRHYLWEKEPRRCRHISTKLDRLILQHKPEAVLMFGSEGCAFSKTEVPIYCFADSIFGSRTDLYDDQKNMSRSSVDDGKLVQQLALNRLRKLFISSQWALDRAQEKYHYAFGPSKFRVVGIGANLPRAIYEYQPAPIEFRKLGAEFVWVGVDWDRKRGQFAIEVVAALRQLGINARLHVVGPVTFRAEHEWVRAHGSLNYDRSADFARLREIFERCCAMLLPSNADLDSDSDRRMLCVWSSGVRFAHRRYRGDDLGIADRFDYCQRFTSRLGLGDCRVLQPPIARRNCKRLSKPVHIGIQLGFGGPADR